MLTPDQTRDPLAAPHCHYCGREILDEQWFARIARSNGPVIFCRPRCVELYLAEPERSEAVRDQWEEGRYPAREPVSRSASPDGRAFPALAALTR